MYSQYVNNSFGDFFRPAGSAPMPSHHPIYVDVEAAPRARPPFHGLLGGIKIPELDMDTVVILVLVYFLISEEGDSIGDTLLIMGILLALGF